MKKALALVFAMTLLSATPAVLRAEDCPMHEGGGCSRGGSGQGDHDKGAGCPILGKVIKQAHFILEHKSELGITDEQAQEVKKIKIEAKK